jgi:hypothetical protein
MSIVNPTTIALIAFVCIFGGVLLGSFFRTLLPEHHLRDASKDAVKLGTGLIATLVALVLGLLVGSAKNSFDAVNSGLTASSAKIILLDHILAQYGPETMEARNLLRRSVASAVQLIWPEDETGKAELKAFETMTGSESVQDKLRELAPGNDSQRLLLSQALQISGELAQAHWLLIEEMQSSLPTPFLVVLVFWLVILFISFGLFAPRNATVIAVLLVCALSVSTAIFLILEMNHPLEGMIKVPSAPLRKALEHLGHLIW